MKKRRWLFSAGACLLCAWIPAFAHHSFQAEYDDEKPITLTGVVTKISADVVELLDVGDNSVRRLALR